MPEDAPADIVLIDEPEQHLHVQWHRQLLPALRELSPETQFLVATHSEDILDGVLSYERFILVDEGDPRARLGGSRPRDLKKKKVVDGLNGLAAQVQIVVDQHPEEADVIIAAAGMFQKRSSARVKPDLAALMGPAPGQILLRAKARRGSAYEWECSTDDGATWLSAGLTTVANTSVQGIARGTTCLFRFRTTRRNITGPWSQILGFYAS